ncbi:MAG TPA: asparagine synthase (glutamine-hydrolyzing) [Thermoleophilaceae bacterium]|nr:asparagine synthase (glutamine-hydrolyzing) [Thermoleophilaceae bacterium]
MCGICGLVATDGGPDRDALEAMNATLRHRGPDSAGAVVNGPVGLAARRLSIIDLETGDQPIANEDRSVHVVQNGEIYNHAPLRAELEAQGHRMRTDHSDTEVLVHLYEQHGPSFAERLRGMFAIAIWDARERRLLLARDRFGIKPLHWARLPGGLAFGSELKCLLPAPGFSREIDPEAVEAFLAFNSIPAPLTIYKSARKLPPGHYLVWQEGSDDVTIERFARELPATAPRPAQPGDVLAALRDSVRAHLVSDVPVGVMLSGGVDSAALAALAASESGDRIRTFTIGFEEHGFDETARARLVAERYGTDHHELVVRPNAVELLPMLAEAFDEPFADSSALPTWLVSELAASHVKVAMSGEGGDELFGGYYTYVADLLAPRVGRLAALARPLIERLPSRSNRAASLDYKAKRFARAATLPPLERHHGWKEIFDEQTRRALVPRLDGSHSSPLAAYREHYAATAGAPELARLQEVDLNVYLPSDLLVKTDRASMAHSLEARVPFLDTAVSDLALALPTSQKVRGFDKKRLLRKAVEPLLPREVTHGRKQGFSIPAAAWLRGELEPFAREVLAPARVREQGWFDPDVVTAVLDRHVAGREDLSRQIWGLMAFSLWHERYA